MLRLALAMGVLAPGCTDDDADPTVEDVQMDPPEHGFQFVVEPFVVPSGGDEQDCHFFEVPYDEPVCVHRLTAIQNPGTHHMNMFRPELGTIHDLYGEPGEV